MVITDSGQDKKTRRRKKEKKRSNAPLKTDEFFSKVTQSMAMVGTSAKHTLEIERDKCKKRD